MKTYYSGELAFIVAILLCSIQSFTANKAGGNYQELNSFNWYYVNSSNQISSITPVFVNMTKAAVLTMDVCKDQVLPNCLFGTNGTVTLGEDISGQPASQRIRVSN